MNRWLQVIVDKVIHAEQSPRRLAASCAVGIFFACSPFLGVQTFLAIGVSMIFHLNATIAIIMLYLINNPITMIPIIILDYLTGYFFMVHLLGYEIGCTVPGFLNKIDTYVRHQLSSWFPTMQFSLLYYFLGGIIFAFVCTLITYPLLCLWFKRLKKSTE
jgi:uncharacterized protein (DUF2062 family)